MKKSKYYYDGMSLNEYCIQNNLNYNSIIHKINRLKNKEEYKNYTNEQLIELANIHNYKIKGTKKEYHVHYYEGKLLRNYCKENNLCYRTIIRRMNKLKKQEKYESYSENELIELSLKQKKAKNAGCQRYYYNKTTLKNYCLENNISYDCIIHRINNLRKREEYIDFTNEELVKLAIENYQKKKITKTKVNYKYYYKGMPLVMWCEKNGFKYNTVAVRIICLKKKEKYKNSSDEELIEQALNIKSTKKNFKYIYNNIPLKEYCMSNNITYSKVLRRINELKHSENYKALSLDNIVKLAIEGNYLIGEMPIKDINDRKYIYYYNNIPLVKYCKENNIDYKYKKNIIIKLRKLEKYKEYTIDEIVKIAVEKAYQTRGNVSKYIYNGMSLSKYCKENNINSEIIRQRIRTLLKNEKYNNYSLNEIVKIAVEKEVKETYMYGNTSVFQYCKDNNLQYSSILRKIFRAQKKDNYSNYSIDDIIAKALQGSMWAKKRKEILFKLNKECVSNEDLIDICKYFGVNIENIKKISNKLSIKQSVYLTYYFGDERDNCNNKIISSSKIKYIKELVNKIKNADESIYKEFQLYELLGIYKCKFFDTRYIILKNINNFVYKKINGICNKYDLNRQDIEEIKNEIDFIILKYLDKFNSSDNYKILNYVNKIINISEKYALKKLKNKKELILNKNIKDDSDSEIIDFIKSKENGVERLFKEDDFSEDTLKLLSKLSKPEYKFMMLRYKENYTYEELANMFNVSIEKVIKKEKNILKRLKEFKDTITQHK